MSTKIYDAFILEPETDFWEFVNHAQTKGFESANIKLVEFHQKLMDAVCPESEVYLKEFNRSWRKEVDSYYKKDKISRSEVALKTMEEGYKESSTSSYRNPFDFNVSITFRELNGCIYLQLYEDMMMKGTLDFIKNDPRLTDYHYQNSTDKPDDISDDEWEQRHDTWDKLYNDETEGRRRFLTMDIMTLNEYPYWEWKCRAKMFEDITGSKF